MTDWECFDDWISVTSVTGTSSLWNVFEEWNQSHYLAAADFTWKVFNDLQQVYAKLVLARQKELTTLEVKMTLVMYVFAVNGPVALRNQRIAAPIMLARANRKSEKELASYGRA